MGGHGVALGGIVVDGGNFDWGQNDRFPTLTEAHFGFQGVNLYEEFGPCLLYTSPSPRDKRQSRMPSSA